ncbi:MAG TPA: proline--tRNA ligase [Candidatus Baltobacteraceae bacterium]|jgi:prolyl-tRNA synthetase|nr:proline--tRNA ligase [Candidatus Baltobacteraceae bacterium]
MRWSQTFIPTLKETPAEAEIISHKLLLRAGLIRKLTGGLYTFLPLGLRALRKVEQIVRQEMDRAGALEIFMPALQPPEIWQQSGRYQSAQGVLLKARDRAKREWILGPTHEEVVTSLVAAEISSYRQLPKNFYQIQTKFRDEIRPRFGLMRAKEFVMKDAYSFDATDEAAQVSYKKMYDAYARIFERCGLKTIAVEADTGVMGGKFSHEFMVPADTGENEVVYCESCHYAANLDKASSRAAKLAGPATTGMPEKFATPGVATIEDLTRHPFDTPAQQQIKTLVYIVQDKPVLILLRGDHQLNEAKLAGSVGTETFRPAEAAEILAALKAHPGSLGAVGVQDFQVIADETLLGASEMTTGANEDGFHWRHVEIARDIAVNKWSDLRLAAAGEPCANCGQPLKIRRAIEVGHVFKLGTKYSEAFNACFLDESGKKNLAIMGCYGIGVSRTLQAVVEQCNDKDGIVWPASVAPYTVCLTPLSVAPESAVMKLAERLYSELTALGVEVILDDRDERPGVKFKDSELIGFPIRLGIGEKSLAKDEVELKPRGGTLTPVKTADAVRTVLAALQER